MLDQSFSAHSFEIIYNLESRKGCIDLMTMPPEYVHAIESIEKTKKRISELRTVKDKSEDELEELVEKNDSLKVQLKQKQDILYNFFCQISRDVNKSCFLFSLDKFDKDGKEVFRLKNPTMAHLLASKQLQHNILKTFKVKQNNRHSILTNIKTFLNSNIPVYVIRTDISSFFESIPQEKLLAMVTGNSLLSNKTKTFIKGIITEYENVKDCKKVAAGFGVPRGVGISSYLSELYMRDLDSIISSRKEVLFYSRYVDDIIIILTTINNQKIEEYYADITRIFANKGLTLKQKSDSSEKCKLFDFYSKDTVAETSMEYIGYKLMMSRKDKKMITRYLMSDRKKERIKERIDHAVTHFETLSKCNIKQAYRDLFDSLNIITGNYKLFKTKSSVKVGLYYNNDLLDGLEDLQELTDYLRARGIEPYQGLMDATEIKDSIYRKINRIDFTLRWKQRKMYVFSLSRLQQIKKWL